MIGFIGGVLFGSITTLFTMCLLIAGKKEESEVEESDTERSNQKNS